MSEQSEVLRLPQGTTASALLDGSMRIVESTNSDNRAQIIEAPAREVFGDNFFGSSEVSKALNIEIDTENLPKIPFTDKILRRAKELGFGLILRVGHTKTEQPLTMKFLTEHVQSMFDAQIGNKKIIFRDPSHYDEDTFFTEDISVTRWALVTNGLVQPRYTDTNYLEHTEGIEDFLIDTMFAGSLNSEIPRKYIDAIIQFREKRSAIRDFVASEHQDDQVTASKLLTELALNTYTRGTPVELLYDLLVYSRLKPDKKTRITSWTSQATSGGGIIFLSGGLDSNGLTLPSFYPRATVGDLVLSLTL